MQAQLTSADVEAVLASYEAIGRRDMEHLMAVTSPAIEIVTRVETHSGIEGARAMYEEAFASDFTNTPEMMIVQGNRVIALTLLRLVGGRTGIETEQRLIEVWTVEDGLVTHLEVLDREPGIVALGLTERVAAIDYLREGYQAFNEGDYDEVVRRMNPDVEMRRLENMPETAPIVGEQRVRQFFEPDVFASQRVEIEWMIAAGRRVLTIGQMHARTSGMEVELATDFNQIWTLDVNGKAGRSDLFQERAEALAALLGGD
jgi:ketosteroid isomerase-like protein